MKENGFNEAKSFVKNMLKDYKISRPETHVGIVEYSDEPSVRLRLDEMFEENLINNVVDEMTPSEGESANLDKALEKSVDKMFSVALGGRPSAKKILVVIAASNTTAKEALKRAAKPLKERGVRIYVVPIGKDSDPETLVVLVPDETKPPKKVKIPLLPGYSMKLSRVVKDDISKSTLKYALVILFHYQVVSG